MNIHKHDLPVADQLTQDPVLGTAEAAKAINSSTVHLRRLVKAGKFPCPLKIGERKLGWRASTILRHLERCEEAARSQFKNSTL